MKVVSLMSFFNEPDELIEECVASLRGIADHLVAVDGPYATFPHSDTKSPVSNWEAIWRGAKRAGIPVNVHSSPRPWDGPHGGECAKRTYMFRAGEPLTTPDEWFFCIDADEVVTQFGDVRQRLAATTLDAGLVMLDEPDGIHAIPQFFRAIRGITVGPAHYQYTTPDGRRLWCCHNDTVPYVDTYRDVLIEHRSHERPDRRELERWTYYLRRDTQQAEIPEIDPDTPHPAPGAFGVDALAAGPPVAPGLVTARH